MNVSAQSSNLYFLSSSFICFSRWRYCSHNGFIKKKQLILACVFYWFLLDFSLRFGLDLITRGVYSILLYNTILHLSVTTTAEFVLYYLNFKGCL